MVTWRRFAPRVIGIAGIALGLIACTSSTSSDASVASTSPAAATVLAASTGQPAPTESATPSATATTPATATVPPPTATTAPPTATVAPPTATKPPATATAAATPSPEPTKTPAPRPAPPTGPTVGLGFGYGMQLDAGTDYPRALQMLTDAGFGWSKVQVRWEDIESQPGNINWGALEQVVNQTQGAGVKLMMSVVTAPAWSRPPGSDHGVPGPPQDPGTYASFIGQVASRFAGRVQAYEIWNEQNLAREWGGPGKVDARQYVDLLKAAYGAVKAADSGAAVILGALTPAGTVDLGQGAIAIDDVAYFQQMYEAGAKGYFDAAGAHPSGFNNAPDLDPLDPANYGRPGGWRGHRSFYYRNFERYREIMVGRGDGNKRIWFTEFGWAADPNPASEYGYAAQNSEDDQANYLVRAVEIARDAGYVGPIFIWNLNFAPTADPGDVQGKRVFSIINPDWSPRAAYRRLAAMPK